MFIEALLPSLALLALTIGPWSVLRRSRSGKNTNDQALNSKQETGLGNLITVFTSILLLTLLLYVDSKYETLGNWPWWARVVGYPIMLLGAPLMAASVTIAFQWLLEFGGCSHSIGSRFYCSLCSEEWWTATKLRPFTVWVRAVAAILLIFAIADHKSQYFTFLRIIVFLSTLAAFIDDVRERNLVWAAAMGVICLLFNPIEPIYLQRRYWLPIDLAAGLILGLSLFRPVKVVERPTAQQTT